MPGDAAWNPTRLLNDIYSALTLRGSVVVVDEENMTVRLVHRSVKQFLLGQDEKGYSDGFSFVSADKAFADIVITYLNYGVFETQLSNVMIPRVPVDGHTASNIVRSIDLPHSVRDVALKFLRSPSQSSYDTGKALVDVGKIRKVAPPSQFCFYVYAKSHWKEHIANIFGHNPSRRGSICPAVRSLLIKLLRSEPAPIEMEQEIRSKNGGTPFICRAAQFGEIDIVRALAEKKVNLEVKDGNGMTPLWCAVAWNQGDVAELLMQKGADVNARRSPGIPDDS